MHKPVTHPTDTNTSPPPDAQPEAPYSLCKKYMLPASVGRAVLDGRVVGDLVTTAVGRTVGSVVGGGQLEVPSVLQFAVLQLKKFTHVFGIPVGKGHSTAAYSTSPPAFVLQ
jgi:hypothetical protein